MGDVIDARSLFRDRRNAQVQVISGAMDPEKMTRAELHNHMLTAHKWGGPKSSTKGRLLSAHRNSHDSPAGWEQPHSHGSQ
jgi:hypothetical protein